MKMKRIGYIDRQLANFHANVYLDLLRGDLQARGWEVAKCWALDEAGGRQWAAEKNVPYVAKVQEMADCDALVVLAPSTPEDHLDLARLAFPLQNIGIILGSLCAFAVITIFLKMLAGIVTLVFISTLAGTSYSVVRNAKIAVGLVLMALFFDHVLGMNLPLY